MPLLVAATLIITALIFPVKVAAQVQPPVVLEVNDKSSVTILPNGNAQIREEISMSLAAFARFKAYYNPLGMLTRELKSYRTDVELTNVSISVDEANNRVIVTYTALGAAVNKKDYWELKVASEKEKVTLSAQTGNVLVFTFVRAATSDIRWIMTVTVTLPQEAKNIRFISETNTLRYEYTPQTTQEESRPSRNLLFLVSGMVSIAIGAIIFISGNLLRIRRG